MKESRQMTKTEMTGAIAERTGLAKEQVARVLDVLTEVALSPGASASGDS